MHAKPISTNITWGRVVQHSVGWVSEPAAWVETGLWSMTHAVSRSKQRARAAELKRVETTKDDYGFSLTTALPDAAGSRKL